MPFKATGVSLRRDILAFETRVRGVNHDLYRLGVVDTTAKMRSALTRTMLTEMGQRPAGCHRFSSWATDSWNVRAWSRFCASRHPKRR